MIVTCMARTPTRTPRVTVRPGAPPRLGYAEDVTRHQPGYGRAMSESRGDSMMAIMIFKFKLSQTTSGDLPRAVTRNHDLRAPGAALPRSRASLPCQCSLPRSLRVAPSLPRSRCGSMIATVMRLFTLSLDPPRALISARLRLAPVHRHPPIIRRRPRRRRQRRQGGARAARRVRSHPPQPSSSWETHSGIPQSEHGDEQQLGEPQAHCYP
jgi:hypothetical protein